MDDAAEIEVPGFVVSRYSGQGRRDAGQAVIAALA
jgi:hypothetical protein